MDKICASVQTVELEGDMIYARDLSRFSGEDRRLNESGGNHVMQGQISDIKALISQRKVTRSWQVTPLGLGMAHLYFSVIYDLLEKYKFLT